MTPGQERALHELQRLQAVDADTIEIVESPKDDSTFFVVRLNLFIGPRERRPGGLPLRERETFLLMIPPDFPFDRPSLMVSHSRFDKFPHVTWTNFLCLYQSKLEWNPTDGLYGFFNRLDDWLARAALNDMDPIEGPLEPPHSFTNPSAAPVVVRANAPVEPGQRWVGWAQIERRPNRLELTDWKAIEEDASPGSGIALAVFLPEPMPMEFPHLGRDLFAAFARGGLERLLFIRMLALTAIVTPEGDPAYLVMGFPMRRSPDGTPRQHIAVWSMSAENAAYLRRSIPELGDSEKLLELREELADAVYRTFEAMKIDWTPVLDDRLEITTRRDARTPAAWFRGKRVLLLGCGALGSWAAELISRADPELLTIVDNSIVKPGLLTRQNYTLEDIGSAKSVALARRLRTLVPESHVQEFRQEAHAFLVEDLNRTASYDLIIDCTASPFLQMKMERDWITLRGTIRLLLSFVIDGTATSCIGVMPGPQSADGPWSSYLRLKYKICTEGSRNGIIQSFYAPAAKEALFQPEPGCSDPTFSGSAIDVSRLAGSALNVFTQYLPRDTQTLSTTFTLPGATGTTPFLDVASLPGLQTVLAGHYRVLISDKSLNQARAAVRQNARIRSTRHETGGLLWGYWDEACGIILILDASGPPPDSRHDPMHFSCGVQGTQAEHNHRDMTSYGVCGFIGMWHTHPNVPPEQSGEDIRGMSEIVAQVGQNRRRAVMLIFGRVAGEPAAGLYVYQSRSLVGAGELLDVGVAQFSLAQPVV
jgi:integrative and conjugative element protein (TIGR02256 family)